MKKVIVVLMIILLVCTIVGATTPQPAPTPVQTTTQAKLPAGWEYSSDGSKITDKSNSAAWRYYDRQPNGYYTRTYGGGSYKSEYNTQTGTRLDYSQTQGLWIKTQVAYYNEGGYVKSVTSSNPSFGEALNQHKQTPATTPTSAPSPTPTPAPTPAPSAGTTPTPSPAPAGSTGASQPTTEQKYGVTLGNLLKTEAGTYTPRSDNNYERNTYDDQGNLETKEIYYPETRTSVVYKITKGGVGESEAVSVKQFDENYGYVEYDRNQPAEMSRILVEHAYAAPGVAGPPGQKPAEGAPTKEPEKPAEGAPTKEPEKPVEGKPVEEEGTDAPIIPRAGGPNAQGATTANPSGEPQYYVDAQGNIYGKPGKGREPAPQAVVEAAKTYGGVASRSGNTYTFKQQVDVDEGIESDYRTTTEVSITTQTDGSYTRTVDQTTEERTGLLERGKWEYKERTAVSTEIGKAADDKNNLVKDDEGNQVKAMTGRSYTTYDKNGKQGITSEVGYAYSERTGKVYQTSAEVRRGAGEGGKRAWSINADGKETYYDKNGKPVDSRSDAELTAAERKAIDKESVRYVNSGAAGLKAWSILGTARSLGRFMRAYDEYAGLRQYSAVGGQAYDQQVQERRAKIQQEFCIASGTKNCLVSKICEQKFDIVPGDTMAGRGPGGQFVTSARINGKRSLAVELEGLSRQQLIDLFGNLTVVAGKRINLTDPKFDPRTLGKVKLRLYNVQFLITNNADKNELNYNIKFKRSEPGSTTSYGTPVKEAKWFPAEEKLAKGATATNEIYKWSPGEYTDVCLTFSPPLPSGSITGKPKMVNEFCVPFKEDYEGPTTIAATLQEAIAQGEQETPTGVAGELV